MTDGFPFVQVYPIVFEVSTGLLDALLVCKNALTPMYWDVRRLRELKSVDALLLITAAVLLWA
jgi:hypothetical protein